MKTFFFKKKSLKTKKKQNLKEEMVRGHLWRSGKQICFLPFSQSRDLSIMSMPYSSMICSKNFYILWQNQNVRPIEGFFVIAKILTTRFSILRLQRYNVITFVLNLNSFSSINFNVPFDYCEGIFSQKFNWISWPEINFYELADFLKIVDLKVWFIVLKKRK